ncbi:MAG: hypothetical protein GXP62_12840 [Oligoflexia bacterium]|nr:hypothetical protein [Oligoflexia bacterium]
MPSSRPPAPDLSGRPTETAIPLQGIELVTTTNGHALPASQLLAATGERVVDLGDDLRAHLAINVIHDGRLLPTPFLTRSGKPVDPSMVRPLFVHERDWGASLVGAELAGALGLDSYLHVHVARVLLDFGRFPGLTPHNASYMERLAINTPFAQWLSFDQHWRLLAHWYDAISDHMDRVMLRKVLTIGVHTYDVYNDSGTLRPEVSIINRALSYQHNNRMPQGLFDALYPDRLGEFTCDRVLPSRISLHLERAGVPVALNFPYCLPEGSVEVRSQVWHFFDYVRDRMHQAYADTISDPVYDLVWAMLLDTNLRSSDCQALRSYLHMFRTPQKGRVREFRTARKAYEHIQAFVHADSGKIIDDYRFGEGRPGAIGIEIRKDLLWELDDKLQPIAPRPGNARSIAQLVAQAIDHYFKIDRATRNPYNQTIRSPRPPHVRPHREG